MSKIWIQYHTKSIYKKLKIKQKSLKTKEEKNITKTLYINIKRAQMRQPKMINVVLICLTRG